MRTQFFMHRMLMAYDTVLAVRSHQHALIMLLLEHMARHGLTVGVLDPLLKGRLVAPDRDDRVQLATLSRVATRAGGELGAAVNSLSELPVDEQREALAELGDLLWRNRAGASKASRRIAALLLEQGLERVGA